MTTISTQLKRLRLEHGLSRLTLAERANVDRATIAALERGTGKLSSLSTVAGALGTYLSPRPSALGTKRRWLGLSARALATMAGTTHVTVAALEARGDGHLSSYEAIASALGERPCLAPIEATWATPPHIIAAVLDGLGGIERFDLDPASPDPPCVPCRRFFTEAVGGLWVRWDAEVVFCNPPYASEELPRWIQKMVEEHAYKRIVALIPFAPNTRAWWTVIASGATINVLRDRLRFGERSFTARLPSAVCTWGLDAAVQNHLSRVLPPHHTISASAHHSGELSEVQDAR